MSDEKAGGPPEAATTAPYPVQETLPPQEAQLPQVSVQVTAFPQQQQQHQDHEQPPPYASVDHNAPGGFAQPAGNVVLVQPQPQTVTASPTVITQIQAQFGPVPMRMTCTNCRADIATAVKKTNGTGAWVWCCVISFFGCICGCCLIPFFTDSTQVFVHTCPNCRTFLGQYRGSASC